MRGGPDMNPSRIFGIAAILTLAIAVVFSMTFPTQENPNYSNATSGGTITGMQLNNSLTVPQGVSVTNGTVNITSDATVLVLTGPMGGSASMFSFVMYGQVNPVLEISQNLTIRFMIVNIDTDAYHNFAITTQAPPYPQMGPGMMYYGTMMSSAFLPPHSGSQYYVTYDTFNTTQTGDFWYICQEYGHASQGMYGQIDVH